MTFDRPSTAQNRASTALRPPGSFAFDRPSTALRPGVCAHPHTPRGCAGPFEGAARPLPFASGAPIARVEDDGRAEAALIARWGAKTLGGDANGG
jgi:hypothetical protein